MTKGVLRSSTSLKVSVLFDMNSDKKCVLLLCINSLKVSELFHMNSKIIQLLFSKSCILMNLLKTGLLQPRPVNQWHLISFACTHTCQYLFKVCYCRTCKTLCIWQVKKVLQFPFWHTVYIFGPGDQEVKTERVIMNWCLVFMFRVQKFKCPSLLVCFLKHPCKQCDSPVNISSISLEMRLDFFAIQFHYF